MSTRIVYDLSRYHVDLPVETLKDWRQIEATTDGFVFHTRGDDQSVDDVVATVRANPDLHEIHANEMVRITVASEYLDDLPFVLTAPRDDDADPEAWAQELLDDHVGEAQFKPHLLRRSLYVNGKRWFPFPSAGGAVLLPEDWPTVRFQSAWAELSFIETGSMVSGHDRTTLGTVTPGVVASTVTPDPGLGESNPSVQVWRRSDTANDAAIFLEWLLANPLEERWDLSLGNMLARLFVEAVVNDHNGKIVYGDYLAVGEEHQPFVGTTDSSEWRLTLSLPDGVAQAALEQLAARSPELRDVVAAVREPDSDVGKARRESLQDLGY